MVKFFEDVLLKAVHRPEALNHWAILMWTEVAVETKKLSIATLGRQQVELWVFFQILAPKGESAFRVRNSGAETRRSDWLKFLAIKSGLES